MATFHGKRPGRLFTALGLGLIVLLGITGIAEPVRTAFIRLTAPIQSAMFAAGNGIRGIGDRFRQAAAVRQENGALRLRVVTLEAENARLRGDLETLKLAEPQLRSLAEQNRSAVLSRLLGRVGEDRHLFLLDRGRRDGITEGAAATAAEGVLVGTIASVSERTSELLLITDSQSAVSARLDNSGGARGLLKGSHRLTLSLTLIPQGEPFAVGDRVVTAGLEPAIPADLLIGEVEAVETKSGDLYQSGRVRPAVSLDRLRVVSVIRLGPAI